MSLSPSESPSLSPSLSPSISPSESPSESPSLSPSISPSVSPSVSLSISPSLSPSISPSPSPILGTTCWGHVTGVLEDNARTFADHWTGTGEITGSGDAEKICLGSGEYMISEVFNTGVANIVLQQNVYIAGDDVTIKYRHGDTPTACEGASWNDYVGQFTSLGFVQIRLEATT